MSWQRSSGYNRRSLVETTMFRYKTGHRPTTSRPDSAQSTDRGESRGNVLNRMTDLAMPVSARIR
jgi:hypothetical protein